MIVIDELKPSRSFLMFLAITLYSQFAFNLAVSIFLLIQVYINRKNGQLMRDGFEFLEDQTSSISEQLQRIAADVGKYKAFVQAVLNTAAEKEAKGNKKKAGK